MPKINRLGSFRFRTWFGTPPGRIKERVEVLTSPGIDFDAVRLLGASSPQFEVESVVDVASDLFAHHLFAAYASVIGGNASKLVWAGFDYDQVNQRAIVLDCQMLSVQRKAAICGALNPGFTTDLRVRWRLLLTPWNLPGQDD